MKLDQLDKQICDRLQKGLKICSQPFADIAEELKISESEVLSRTNRLLESGIIRRLAAMINYQSLGRASTLVAAAAEADKIEKVADAVSRLGNVSHNYQRDHFYNLWFTLQGRDETDIQSQLKKLSVELKINFVSLPVEKFFKLDVNFDVADTAAEVKKKKPAEQVVELTDLQRKILTEIQHGIKPVSNTFDFLCDGRINIESALEVLQQLISLGVIKRIAAVLNHRLLGYNANIMFVCKVKQSRIAQAGQKLAGYRQVSHCYQRKAFAGFDYNLFAMIHAKNRGEIISLIDEFTDSECITDYKLLATIKEFKKKPVRYEF